MNLKDLTDEALHESTEKLVREEREILGRVLHHLREIERRRLFSKFGFGSLFEYATKQLNYSEDQAWRRISAMRLLKEMPEIESKIADGTLTLSHVGMAKTLFGQEDKIGNGFSREQKLQILESLQGTSKREAEKIVVELSSDDVSPTVPKESVKCLKNNEVEIRFRSNEELLEKIERLKGLLAHQNPNIELGELIDQLCDLGLAKWSSAKPESDNVKTKKPAKAPSQKQIRRDVWATAGGNCQNCGSNYALEIDHVFPKALGGDDSPENLRLLCRSCNQRAAIEQLGLFKMEKYLEPQH